MIQNIFEDYDELLIYAEDQCWDDDTLKELRDKHNVFFMTTDDAVCPVMVVERKEHSPLIVIGSEDDGTIWFKKSHGSYEFAFDAYWTDSFIADLLCAQRFAIKKMKGAT